MTPGKDIPLVNLNVPAIDPKKPINKMLAPKTAFEKGFESRLNEIYKQANITPVGAPSIPALSGIQPQHTPTPYPAIAPVQNVSPGPRPVADMMNDRAVQQGTTTMPPQQPQPMVQFPMQKHSSYTTGFVKRAAEYGFSKKEIAAIYKKAEGEDPTQAPQQASAVPSPAAPAPEAGGQPSIPPELLAQLVQLLQQQQGSGQGAAPSPEQGGAPDQAKIMQYLQQQGGK